jgi:hypothetical protein
MGALVIMVMNLSFQKCREFPPLLLLSNNLPFPTDVFIRSLQHNDNLIVNTWDAVP